MNVETALLVAAGAVAIVGMQLVPRRVTARTLVVIPALVAYFAWRNLPSGPIPASQAGELAIELVLAVVAGVWQARVTRVFERDGQWYMQGGPLYLAVWALFIAVRLGLHAALSGGLALGPGAGGVLWVDWVAIAAVWAVRALTLYFGHPQLASALQRTRRYRHAR